MQTTTITVRAAIKEAHRQIKADPQPHNISSFSDLVMDQNPHEEGTVEFAAWFEEAEDQIPRAWARM